MLLRMEACSQSRVYTEQLLHTEAFTQREAFGQSSLYNLIHTETWTRRCPSFYTEESWHTQRHLHKSSSHRYGRCVYTQAFEHRCLYTQKHLHRDALTYTRLCTQKLLHRDFFRRIAEALTQRRLYTANPLHTEAFTHRSSSTQKLFHRSFYTEKLLRTGSFTHRRLYTEKLVHTEAFTHRSFYTEKPLLYTQTEKPIPQSSFYMLPKIAILLKFLTFGHHYVRKGCIDLALENRNFWRWAIILRERVAPGLVKAHFYTTFIFARNGCAWCFNMDKVAILHQFLNVCIWR